MGLIRFLGLRFGLLRPLGVLPLRLWQHQEFEAERQVRVRDFRLTVDTFAELLAFGLELVQERERRRQKVWHLMAFEGFGRFVLNQNLGNYFEVLQRKPEAVELVVEAGWIGIVVQIELPELVVDMLEAEYLCPEAEL